MQADSQVALRSLISARPQPAASESQINDDGGVPARSRTLRSGRSASAGWMRSPAGWSQQPSYQCTNVSSNGDPGWRNLQNWHHTAEPHMTSILDKLGRNHVSISGACSTYSPISRRIRMPPRANPNTRAAGTTVEVQPTTLSSPRLRRDAAGVESTSIRGSERRIMRQGANHRDLPRGDQLLRRLTARPGGWATPGPWRTT
jgi:hypothetical protein